MDEKYISESRFWDALWKLYIKAPSIALCRIPELEYASALDIEGKDILDHCCGDGQFAKLAWEGRKLAAGCDISENAIELAAGQDIYSHLDACDASIYLPYKDASFDLVFNNSALEHISDLDNTLLEIARILVPGGALVFNVLNHRYFEWWPLNKKSMGDYRAWQPFYHALSLVEWKERLKLAGFQVVDVSGYFDRKASQELARLDYAFSGAYIANRISIVVWLTQLFPHLMKQYWLRRLSSLSWRTEPDSGAGYFIKAVLPDE